MSRFAAVRLVTRTCGGAGCCPWPPVPWRLGRPGMIAGPWTAGGSGDMPGGAEEGIEVEMLPLVLSLAPSHGEIS